MSWNRWTARVLVGLLAVVAFGGCKQQLFLEPGDYAAAVTANLPRNLETNPHDAITPSPVNRIDPVAEGPSNVLDPTRPARYVTLKECIAVALEQGNSGFQNPLQLGSKQEILLTFTGTTINSTDAIRAFALDPANVGANIERALSKFDARWITSMQWQKNDNPVAAQFVSFQSQNDTASFSTALVKPLPTGGVAGITFNVNYTKFSNIPASQVNSFVSPNYLPQVQFVFEQPLLQLFGVEVNQLTNQAPTSLLINGLRPSGGQTTEGILLTRIRFDQSRADFERIVNYLLVNVETAYWNLYAGYYALYAQEEGLRQSYEGYRFTKSRVEAGTDPPQQLNQSRAQLELFRAQVLRARGQVLEFERQLRGLLGLRSDDGKRLVPVDEPNLTPFHPDFYDAANETVANRPELLIARQDLKAQQLNLLLQKNLRRPDLRFFSSYNIAGIGTRLDGSDTLLNAAGTSIPGNAFSSLADNRFNSWTLGLRLDMPLGFRDQNAAVRQSQLQLTRSYLQLRDLELKALEYLISQYRLVVQNYAVIPPLRARREELQMFVVRARTRIEIGQFVSADYFNYLQVQRDLADAISQEFSAIAQYNSSIAAFEFAKGTIMQYNNVSLADGPLPPWVQKRAADNERERTEAALKLRERPAHDPAPASPQHPIGPGVGVPTLPPITDMPPSVEPIPVPRQAGPDKVPMIPSNPLPTPAPLPGANQGARQAAPPAAPQGIGGPQPLPFSSGAAPAPAANNQPDPSQYFVPNGTTTTVPRFPPITPTPRGSSGPSAPPVQVPPGATIDRPTFPVTPNDPRTGNSDGVPATLPSNGRTSPVAPSMPTSTNYPPY